ncbi:MAG: hypothetical protein GXO91_03490 [FCB group bacterium]|nr:hypothetical protein [FCB group bacterium]
MDLSLTRPNGFTLLEAITSLIIFAAIALGLTYTFSEIQAYFRQQTYFEDADHYGNTVLDMIADSLMLATEVTLTSRNGYSVIDLKIPHRSTETGQIVNSHPVFFADEEKGVLLNGEPIWLFKSFKSTTTVYELQDFWCEPLPASIGNYSPALSKIRRSTYVLSMAVRLKVQRKSSVVKKVFKFRRKVFAANDYL